MKRWENINRIKVGLDFGPQKTSEKMGDAAIAEGRVYLQFDEAFTSKNINLSPVRLKLDNSLQEGARDLEGLPGLLHDSLPDGWARLVLDRALRKAGFDHTSLTTLDRLALVGTSGSGALTYTGSPLKSFNPPSVDFDTAAALVGNAPEEDDADRIRDALTLTGSLGGARPKANIWKDRDTFSTAETQGSTLWLAKFPAKADGPNAGAVEYAYSLMAKAAGIDMPPTVLLPSKETAGYFAVERFDRTASGGRLHMHSFGGLLNASTANSALSYKELLIVTGALTQQIGTDIPNVEQQIARMAFNVLARNRDDHVKNHAFLMDENGRWSPAPAFDLTYSNLPEHALLVGRNGRNPDLDDMLVVAREVHINDKCTKEIVERVREAIADWKTHAKEANVAPALVLEIDASLNPPQKGGGGGINQATYTAWKSGLER